MKTIQTLVGIKPMTPGLELLYYISYLDLGLSVYRTWLIFSAFELNTTFNIDLGLSVYRTWLIFSAFELNTTFNIGPYCASLHNAIVWNHLSCHMNIIVLVSYSWCS